MAFALFTGFATDQISSKKHFLKMNDIHSKDFKKKYLKCKYKLRQWEDKFFAENGRKPTRADIKTSDISIKEYYKQYWMLKTQILEDQILGEDTSFQIDLVISSGSDGVLKEQTNTLTSPKKAEASSIEEVKQDAEKNSPTSPKENVSQSKTDQIDNDTWGAHLNRRDITSSIETEKCTLLNSVVVGRLFEGSSFKKRNPRKALSLARKKSNKSLSDDCNTSFDFQEVSSLDFFSPDPDSQLDISQDPSLSSSQLLNGTSFSVEDYCSPNVKALISSTVPFSPILTRSKDEESIEATSKQNTQPVSLIHAIASDPSVAFKAVRSLNAGWVERCSNKEERKGEPEERKSNCDSGFESMESSAPDLLDAVKNNSHEYDSSDDDIIGASDNEMDEKGRVSCTIVASQKRKSDVSFLAEEEKALCEKGSSSDEKEPKHENKKIKIDPYEFVDKDPPKTKEEVKRSILEKKMKSGTLNDNFVRINLKKKVFVRGKRNFNYARYKKQEWKNKKKNLQDESKCGSLVQCYKCGETGHFSRNCKKSNEDKLLSAGEESDDETLPTLEEAEKIAREKAESVSMKKTSILNFEKPLVDKWLAVRVEPYYQLNENGSIKQTPEEVYHALLKFGHSEFRPGQEETIMRILSGQSTLLTIATGGGKSLCYQLPAYLYASRSRCITLVVSPLVSLMEDQVAGSSSFFKVGCLHTSQTQKQRESVIQDAKNGKLYALLVSPEAVVSGETFNGFGHVFRQLPPIAFACIDEVHCISQWSHNFRPSYLMISKVLKEKLGVTVTLGLTATATFTTINSIVKELGISEKEGVIKDTPLPGNLCLSISRDENKDEALLRLLKSPRFNDFNSILIYCTRRDECERLAVFLRTTLQVDAKQYQNKSKSLSWTAESYHAGMAASRRKQVQKAFMCGNLRIVVATIAFGMGINKQDIRGVIHYNMPKDFESYVQEVGRAGRDGLPAHCHLFLDSLGQDLNELRRHIYANSVDRHVLRKLLQRVFKSCNCKGNDDKQKCEGHEIAFDCSDTIQTLDIPEENIYTLLCYLELHSEKFVKVMTPVYINCKIKSYKGVKGIHSAARKCPPLAYACALTANSKKEKSNVLEFNVLEVANRLSWDSTIVKNELKRTEWELMENSRWRKTGIAVEFSDLGFRVCSRGDMTPSELDQALDYLIQRVEDRDKRAFTQLDITFSTFDFFASDDYSCGGNSFDETKSEELKRAIRSYFENEELFTGIPLVELQVNVFDEEALATDVRILLSSYRDNTFNGRAVARIFHGIQSPNYPASVWYKCKFWRKHIDKDFNKIIRIATREIIRLKP